MFFIGNIAWVTLYKNYNCEFSAIGINTRNAMVYLLKFVGNVSLSP